jgi:PIN domain nuclease of toxin-antitoxin system
MTVLDASALLALLFREPGEQRVAAALAEAPCMSTVNLAEVLARFARDGRPVGPVWKRLQASAIEWVPLSADLAAAMAELAPAAARHGLSLGDRACLALGLARGRPVLTADRAWCRLGLGLEVVAIR